MRQRSEKMQQCCLLEHLRLSMFDFFVPHVSISSCLHPKEIELVWAGSRHGQSALPHPRCEVSWGAAGGTAWATGSSEPEGRFRNTQCCTQHQQGWGEEHQWWWNTLSCVLQCLQNICHWTSTACYVAGFPSHPVTYLYPCSVISLPLGFAVLLSAVPWLAGATSHSHILGIPAPLRWMWGLTPSPQEPFCTPLQTHRATVSHPLGWAQIYHCNPLLPSKNLLSLLFSPSVLDEVALGYRPPLLI